MRDNICGLLAKLWYLTFQFFGECMLNVSPHESTQFSNTSRLSFNPIVWSVFSLISIKSYRRHFLKKWSCRYTRRHMRSKKKVIHVLSDTKWLVGPLINFREPKKKQDTQFTYGLWSSHQQKVSKDQVGKLQYFDLSYLSSRNYPYYDMLDFTYSWWEMACTTKMPGWPKFMV